MTNEKSTASQWTVITVSVSVIAVIMIIIVIALVIATAVQQAAENRKQIEIHRREFAHPKEVERETVGYRVQILGKPIVGKRAAARNFNTYAEARQFVTDTFAEELASGPDNWEWVDDYLGKATRFSITKPPTAPRFSWQPGATITRVTVPKTMPAENLNHREMTQ